MRRSIAKAQKDLAALQAQADAAAESSNLGSLTNTELGEQREADMTRILANQEHHQARKTRRQVRAGGPLSVKDANSLILSREIKEAEKERQRWKRRAKNAADKLAQRATKEGFGDENRDENNGWVAGDDGQPLYCIDYGPGRE
ncbi:hypothetical protein EYZ11_013585 [Aspergillus tanneri]|uniref:Uncharacterized protein n=1 Tax=Aspergillus tanneri TaxID=1220188 RepID=A0A4S3IXB1_9EURO|nr:hypothetical protein EYZ11_013585 [Aspergillus tanneri]